MRILCLFKYLNGFSFGQTAVPSSFFAYVHVILVSYLIVRANVKDPVCARVEKASRQAAVFCHYEKSRSIVRHFSLATKLR